MIVLALALYERFHAAAPFAVRIGTAAGVIGGALIMTAGVEQLWVIPGRMAAFGAQNHEARSPHSPHSGSSADSYSNPDW